MADISDESDQSISNINITPLVDVCLVLVLIFMVTMPLTLIHGIDIKRQLLERYGLTTPQENVRIHLVAQSGFYIKDPDGQERLIPYAEFGMVLGQVIRLCPTKRVLLEVDKDVPHGQTVWVLDLSKQNGAEDLSIFEGKD